MALVNPKSGKVYCERCERWTGKSIFHDEPPYKCPKCGHVNEVDVELYRHGNQALLDMAFMLKLLAGVIERNAGKELTPGEKIRLEVLADVLRVVVDLAGLKWD